MSGDDLMARRTPSTETRVREIAQSTNLGICRIKRAKIILGAWDGAPVDRLVLDFRVPPESVARCLSEFAAKGLAYFDTPTRRPTAREARVEQILETLDSPPPPRSKGWRQPTVRYIGCDFSARDIQRLRRFIAEHPDASRVELARGLCDMLGLHHRDGRRKQATAVDILKRMNMDNLIRLPDMPRIERRPIPFEPTIEVPPGLVRLHPHDIPTLEFRLVETPESSAQWREMIERFHYVKASRLFGPQLRYLVYGGRPEEPASGRRLLAALAFGPSAWSLASRDEYIGWSHEVRKTNLHLIINNVRFLILPWIHSKNLASRILGGVTRRVALDWERRYRYRPLLLETFVQLDRHTGTSYRAANWIQVGTTDGYSLYSAKKAEVAKKAIFLYPLHPNFRERLKSPRTRDR